MNQVDPVRLCSVTVNAETFCSRQREDSMNYRDSRNCMNVKVNFTIAKIVYDKIQLDGRL